jgi:hypothetical protein
MHPSTSHSQKYAALAESSKFHGEKNDCTVKALAISGNLTYGVAHTMMAKRGRKPRMGSHTAYVISALQELGKNVEHVSERASFQNVKTIKAIQSLNLRGCYLIRTSGHILAMESGIVHDWTANRCHRICDIYRVS